MRMCCVQLQHLGRPLHGAQSLVTVPATEEQMDMRRYSQHLGFGLIFDLIGNGNHEAITQ